MPLSVIIPPCYDPDEPIPVLYLLHGHSINHDYFTTRTHIEKYANSDSVLCVMPQADNSWWINSCVNPQDRFEDYLMNDVREYIENKYSIDTNNQFIAGFSMGGYGALSVGLRHPGRFKFVASIAGAISYPRDQAILGKFPINEFALPSLNAAFGRLHSSYRNEHDPFSIFSDIPLEKLPYIFLFSGIQDYFPAIPAAQRELADSLKSIGALYEYYELQGGHNSITVDPSLRIFLERVQSLRHRKYKSLSPVLKQIILKRGIETAVDKYYALKSQEAAAFDFNENALNALGYELLSIDRFDEAIAIFQLNNKNFPESSNTYDSLGEAFEMAGRLDKALENYRKALDMATDQSPESVSIYKEHIDRVLDRKSNE